MPIPRRDLQSSLDAARQDSSLTQIEIEWLVSKDIPHVLEIELSRVFDPWTDTELRNHIGQPGTVAVVARDRDGDIAGWCLYAAEDKGYVLKRLSVCMWRKRRGVASALIQYVQTRMQSSESRYWVRCDVPESQMEVGCILLREHGFVSRLMFSEREAPSHWNTPCSGIEMIFRKGWE